MAKEKKDRGERLWKQNGQDVGAKGEERVRSLKDLFQDGMTERMTVLFMEMEKPGEEVKFKEEKFRLGNTESEMPGASSG